MVNNDILSCAVQMSNTSVFQRMGKSIKTDQSGKNLSQGLFFLINYYDFWLYWVFVAFAQALLQLRRVGATSCCSAQASHCDGFSSCRVQALGYVGFSSCSKWAQQLQLLGSRAAMHGLSCSVACGIFPNQGSNSCLHIWQKDYYPPFHHGSPNRGWC